LNSEIIKGDKGNMAQSTQTREEKLEALGFPLDHRTPEGALVEAVHVDGNIAYASGQVPFVKDQLVSKGKVPSQVSVEDAQRAAALCAANVLRALHGKLGSLERIESVIRITGYVNADPDFSDAHLVINGASQLVRDVLGDAGKHARTALGVAQLPLGASTEIEMFVRVKE
jgi:enamine deaminase RidA (YjgF/YER057c/UK114 family)